MHGTAPPQTLGGAEWPSAAPAQLHHAEGDPYVDTDDIEALERSVRGVGAPLEVFAYPGEGHLFADPNGPDYDGASAKLMLEREIDFLSRLKV